MKEIIDHPFFSYLSATQHAQLAAYQEHLLHFNRRINLISRDDEPHIAERHILHALALTHLSFPDGCVIADWGTGGGLPAIPLAIVFPQIEIHAVDAVGKKVQAVQAMARRMELENLHPWHGRAEHWPGTLDYSVSRATAPLLNLWHWHMCARAEKSLAPGKKHWAPGLICLKGGDLTGEFSALTQVFPNLVHKTTDLEPLLDRSYFRDKYIVEIYERSPADA